MVAHAGNEMLWLETFIDDIVDNQQDIAGIALQHIVHNTEIIVVVEHVEIVDNGFIGDVLSRETHHLVENRKSITQSSICLLGNDVQRLRLGVDAFHLGNMSEVLFNIFNGNTFEIKYLTS